jgi:hypothetical protein
MNSLKFYIDLQSKKIASYAQEILCSFKHLLEFYEVSIYRLELFF